MKETKEEKYIKKEIKNEFKINKLYLYALLNLFYLF